MVWVVVRVMCVVVEVMVCVVVWTLERVRIYP